MAGERRKPWFRVKRYGYGVGLPIAWEGWLVLFLYLAAIVAASALISSMASLVVVVLLTPAVLYISYVRSDGEWRWRSGS
jgi:hypothetical protein